MRMSFGPRPSPATRPRVKSEPAYRVLHLSSWGYMTQCSTDDPNHPWKDGDHSTAAEIYLARRLEEVEKERDRLITSVREISERLEMMVASFKPKRRRLDI